MKLNELATPALILNKPKMLENIARMRAQLAKRNVPLRPHLKTSKSAEAARHMLDGQPGGAAVSTLAEAEYFFAHGITDIIYAVPVAPGKLGHVAELKSKGLDLNILLDSVETARTVAREGEDRKIVYKTLIEIDSDGHRTGLLPESAELIKAGKILHDSPGAEMSGVLTHAGSSYSCRSVHAITAMAEQERAAAVLAAERLRAEGLPCPIVSVGSTPTASFAKNLDGVTEVRAGVFVFQDLFQASLGVCTLDDIAVSVLTEIIGVDPVTNRVFIDAGALALSKDRSTEIADEDMGYGLALRPGASPSAAGLIVRQVFQEHGVAVPRMENQSIKNYKIGDRLLVLPNHACMTAAAHGAYHVTEDNETVSAVWERVNGWRAADRNAFAPNKTAC